MIPGTIAISAAIIVMLVSAVALDRIARRRRLERRVVECTKSMVETYFENHRKVAVFKINTRPSGKFYAIVRDTDDGPQIIGSLLIKPTSEPVVEVENIWIMGSENL
jgi:hypothetical protein